MGESSWRLSLPPSLTWARPSLSSVKILFFFPLIFIGVELLYHTEFISAVQQSESATCCSVAQSGPTLCDPTDCSTPGFPVLHHLPELAQTHVHRVGDAMQPSHPLLSPLLPPSVCPSIRVHIYPLFLGFLPIEVTNDLSEYSEFPVLSHPPLSLALPVTISQDREIT